MTNIVVSDDFGGLGTANGQVRNDAVHVIGFLIRFCCSGFQVGLLRDRRRDETCASKM